MKNEKNNKRLRYLKAIAQNSLDQFLAITKSNSEVVMLLKNDWEGFIQDDKKLIMEYDRCIKNFETLLGFKNELSVSLSEEQAVKKVGDHFAEIDLAKHIIRGYKLNNKVLTKLTESNVQMCDFELLLGEFCIYCEAKFVSSIGEKRINEKVKKSLEQIKSTKEQKNKGENLNDKGIIWIFTYNQPADPSNFQKLVRKIKSDFSQKYHFDFLLNVQTYKTGIYGDAKTNF
ncbi:hypothetical protein KAW43_01050 [Candidatus Parcubacteria bacterium]|nr:hypothetical protein [Candidatus Parcubacteria bacterium]